MERFKVYKIEELIETVENASVIKELEKRRKGYLFDLKKFKNQILGTHMLDDSLIFPPYTTPITQLVYETIILDLELPTLVRLEEEELNTVYGLDLATEVISDYYIVQSEEEVPRVEIAIVAVWEEENVDSIKEAMLKRQQVLLEQYEQYAPEQVSLIENYRLEQVGNIVVFVVAKDAGKMMEMFLNTGF
ncbi:MAG: DUF4358 domain-containing protein [Cellulosilyticaceae bacterium]